LESIEMNFFPSGTRNSSDFWVIAKQIGIATGKRLRQKKPQRTIKFFESHSSQFE
jgi:hypothetical protein